MRLEAEASGSKVSLASIKPPLQVCLTPLSRSRHLRLRPSPLACLAVENANGVAARAEDPVRDQLRLPSQFDTCTQQADSHETDEHGGDGFVANDPVT